MRIAFPTENGNGLQDKIAGHFGRAPFYLIVDLDKGVVIEKIVARNPALKEHEPGIIPLFLRQMGVDILVCDRIGERAAGILERMGVRVIRGKRGTVSDILKEIQREAL